MKANLKLINIAYCLYIMMSIKEFKICIQHIIIYNLYCSKFSAYNKESAESEVRERVN